MLKVSNINKSYGGVKCLCDVSMEVSRGETVGLIGTNGAGKTTLFNIISGFESLDSGSITLDGNDITGLESFKLAHLHLSRTFQSPRLFGEMTVYENVYIANKSCYADRYLIDYSLTLLDLKRVCQSYPEVLCYSDQKRLELARAIATGAQLIMTDELCAGLSVAESEAMLRLLKKARRELGLTLLVIEHDMDYIQSLCSRVCLLDRGRLICEGTPRAVFSSLECRSILTGKPNKK